MKKAETTEVKISFQLTHSIHQDEKVYPNNFLSPGTEICKWIVRILMKIM